MAFSSRARAVSGHTMHIKACACRQMGGSLSVVLAGKQRTVGRGGVGGGDEVQRGALLRRLRAVSTLRHSKARWRGILRAPQVVEHGVVQRVLLHRLARADPLQHRAGRWIAGFACLGWPCDSGCLGRRLAMLRCRCRAASSGRHVAKRKRERGCRRRCKAAWGGLLVFCQLLSSAQQPVAPAAKVAISRQP